MRRLLLASLLLWACAPTRPAAVPEPVPAARAPAPAATPATTTRFPVPPAGEGVLVLWTASVQGYVEPCGCTADPLGGVARLTAAVEEARRAWGGRVVLLDGGDLLFERADDRAAADRCQAEARSDLLVDSYGRAGLAATVLGPLDDVRGASFRDARLARAGIPTVGVGPTRALTEGARGTSRLLMDAGGVKLGVTGFRVDDHSQVAAVRAALTREVGALLEEGARAVVALAQAPRGLTAAVARGVPGLDAVLQGRDPGEAPRQPERLIDERGVGPAWLAAGMQAQHLGVLELALEGRAPGAALPLDDRAARHDARRHLLELKDKSLGDEVGREPDPARRAFLQERQRAVLAELEALRAAAADAARPLGGPHLRAWSLPLPRGSTEEPAAAQALLAYRASVPALVERCEADVQCPPPPKDAASYVGVAVCGACHAPAVAFWSSQTVRRPAKDERGQRVEREVGHARAWHTLVEAGKERDRSCVPCHSVGFDEPGGPCTTTEVMARGLEGVQCESCHGPGSVHVAQPVPGSIARDTDEAQCRRCHKVPHIETTASFVYEELRRRTLGPGHGRPAPTSSKEPAP